jgi:hypothetical protein
MDDTVKRRLIIFGGLGLVSLIVFWQGARYLNPLSGTWEDDGTVCSIGLLGGGECANERGQRFQISVRLGSNEMTFGDYRGSYELLPGDSFIFKASEIIEGSEPQTAAEPRSWREHEDMTQMTGRSLGSGTIRSIREQYAGDFQRKFSKR